jgi:fatty-acyl-CoA synthase
MRAVPPVDGLTIGAALRASAVRHPTREALVFSQRELRLTYSEYDHRVDDVARSLLGMGIGKGDHVAVWATNWPEWILILMATARIGAVLVTVNPAYGTHELSYALKQSSAKALFLIDRFKNSDYFGQIVDVCPELAHAEPGELRVEALPELRWVVSMTDQAPVGVVPWSRFMELGDAVSMNAVFARELQLDAEDPINLQYTSGTTGFPKGVLLSHRNVLLNAWFVGEAQNLTAKDRVCLPVPFYHCFGVVIGVLGCAVRGATLLVPSECFEPEPVLDCVENERATSLYGVPTMFVALLEHESFPNRELSSLRTGIMAGSPCPVEVMNRVVDDMGAYGMTVAYGLTEASPAITQTSVDDPVEVRVSTVGRPMPGVQVRIVNPDTGLEVPDGECGELQSRGHNTMLGYYDMPEATAETIVRGGWLRTGDLAECDPNGNYRITGRIKDMVMRERPRPRKDPRPGPASFRMRPS